MRLYPLKYISRKEEGVYRAVYDSTIKGTPY